MITATNSSKFLDYLHSFRGFAIINIVTIHCVVAALVAIQSMDMSNPIALINEVLFHDSTLYFAVISGLLFTAVLKAKGYKRFYLNKLKYVIFPYVFITAIVTILKVNGMEDGTDQHFLITYFEMLSRDLIYGKATGLFWYIPVLIFLYLVTPLVDFLMNLKKVGIIISVLLMVTPLIVSRVQMAFDYILSIETMIFFTGAYAVGMFVGNNLETILSWLRKFQRWFLVISVMTTGVLFYLFINDVNMYEGISLQQSFFYLQKMSISALFIVLFHKMGDRQPRWLKPFARDSFGIYFFHGFFAFGGIPLFMFILDYRVISPFNTLIGAILLFAFSVGVSMLLVLGFRKLMGKNSRMLVGS